MTSVAPNPAIAGLKLPSASKSSDASQSCPPVCAKSIVTVSDVPGSTPFSVNDEPLSMSTVPLPVRPRLDPFPSSVRLVLGATVIVPLSAMTGALKVPDSVNETPASIVIDPAVPTFWPPISIVDVPSAVSVRPPLVPLSVLISTRLLSEALMEPFWVVSVPSTVNEPAPVTVRLLPNEAAPVTVSVPSVSDTYPDGSNVAVAATSESPALRKSSAPPRTVSDGHGFDVELNVPSIVTSPWIVSAGSRAGDD